MTFTKDEIIRSGEMDDELAQILAKLTMPEPAWSDISNAVNIGKERAKDLIESLGQPPEGVVRSEKSYTADDGVQLRAKVYQPTTTPPKGSPLIVIFHGGGFCTGVPESEESGAINLVKAYGAVCVSPSYRLAPDYPFPYAPQDAWKALEWAAESAQELGATPSAGFVVGGTSAGANLATVVAHRARDEGLPYPLTGQFLAVPMVCSNNTIPNQYQDQSISWEQNKDAPVLPVAAVNMFMGGYKPDESDGVNYSIINHPKGHAGLPPTVIIASGLDPMRDQALIYEKMIREDFGVETKLYLYPGVPHIHWSIFPMLEKSQRFLKDRVEAYGWLLSPRP